jgi:hypothetical protein
VPSPRRDASAASIAERAGLTPVRRFGPAPMVAEYEAVCGSILA